MVHSACVMNVRFSFIAVTCARAQPSKISKIGDIVTFELLEDSVNGEHALRVNRPTGVGE
jgi:hypothetical protein